MSYRFKSVWFFPQMRRTKSNEPVLKIVFRKITTEIMKRYLEILIKYSNEDLYSIISHVYLSKK